MKKQNNNFLHLLSGAGIAVLFLSLVCLGFAVDGEYTNWKMVAVIGAIMIFAGIIAYRAMSIIERREKK